MPANKEVEKEIKKLRIFDYLLLAFGRHKIIFKEVGNTKHLTLSFLKEGILDIHETVEGKKKSHTPLERLNLKKFAGIKKAIITEVIRNLKEIDISDPKYVDTKVLIIEKEALRERVQELTRTKGKEMVFERSKLEDAMKDSILPIKDLQNQDFKVAFLLKEDEEPDLLYRVDGKYFLIRLDDLEASIKNIFEKLRS